MRLLNLAGVTIAAFAIGSVTAHGQQNPPDVEARVQSILSRMTLLEKLSYIGGTGFFDVKAIPLSNLNTLLNPQIFQTDGPLGVRRNAPSVRFPAGLNLAATWSRWLAHEQGVNLGQDTRARGYFAIEGPGMDLYRVPLNGRNFEYLTGEDPYLGAQLGAEEVVGIQSQGVWASAKHYVCNDEEENRTHVNILADERTLREIYLPPFEAAVKVGHAATVMGAYNQVNGNWCCENPFLIQKVLKGDWGFKGILVSDYDAIHSGTRAAEAGCDVDLPAGTHMNAAALGPVLGSGLSLTNLDDKVRRILRGVISFGFLDREQLDLSIPLDNPFSEAASLQIAREGIVLLVNKGALLPLDKGKVRSIAVLGPEAQGPPPTGFGSSYVMPVSYVSELDGMRAAVPAGVPVDLIGVNTLDPAQSEWEHADAQGTPMPGLQAQYFSSNDLSGSPVSRTDVHLDFQWDGGAIPAGLGNPSSFSARWTGHVRPQVSGDHVFKVRGDGGFRLYVNGQKLIDNFAAPARPPVGFGPTVPLFAKVSLESGQVYPVVIEYRRVGGFFNYFEQGGLTGVQAGWASLQAPANLAGYSAVVMCVGLNEQYEGEGQDRAFQLPEFQDELIQNISRVNPRTIVVLHGGGNFDSTGWLAQVAGCLHAFYPGQNGGQALAEILFGDVNPSAKLPVTFERRLEDNPAYATFPNPVNQHPASIAYREGLYVGYRGYEKNGTVPLYPFGFGLSYTTYAFSDLKVEPAVYDGRSPEKVTFKVKNTGRRPGREVAQVYVGQQHPSIDRPVKELKGFEKVSLAPGQSTQITLSLDQRSIAFFNTRTQRWDGLPGTYRVSVGDSSQDILLTGSFDVPAELTAQP